MISGICIPLPGTPVRGSKTGAPIMALLDLLGRRWAVGIVWVLAERGPLSFNGLQGACETIAPSVLSRRLKELDRAKLVENDGATYRLTVTGKDLFELIRPLGKWAREQWTPIVIV